MKSGEALTRMAVSIHYYQNKVEVGQDVLEGEVEMSQEQQDGYKQLIGDGLAEIVVSREISEMSYGNGGKVFVSVKLTVDQSAAGINAGEAWAKAFAHQKIWEAHGEMRQQLVDRGIIKP